MGAKGSLIMELAIRYFGTVMFLLILAIYSLIYLNPQSIEYYILMASIGILSIVLILALREILKARKMMNIEK